MYFREFLAKFVSMKNSINFLPERKQNDLRELVDLIRDEVRDVVMIILYGSYAKDTYVECDERRDFGVKTYYMSRLRPAGRYEKTARSARGNRGYPRKHPLHG